MHYILLYIVYPLQVTWHHIVYNTVKQGLFLSNSGAVYACEQHSGVCVPRYKQGGGLSTSPSLFVPASQVPDSKMLWTWQRMSLCWGYLLREYTVCRMNALHCITFYTRWLLNGLQPGAAVCPRCSSVWCVPYRWPRSHPWRTPDPVRGQIKWNHCSYCPGTLNVAQSMQSDAIHIVLPDNKL